MKEEDEENTPSLTDLTLLSKPEIANLIGKIKTIKAASPSQPLEGTNATISMFPPEITNIIDRVSAISAIRNNYTEKTQQELLVGKNWEIDLSPLDKLNPPT